MPRARSLCANTLYLQVDSSLDLHLPMRNAKGRESLTLSCRTWARWQNEHDEHAETLDKFEATHRFEGDRIVAEENAGTSLSSTIDSLELHYDDELLLPSHHPIAVRILYYLKNPHFRTSASDDKTLMMDCFEFARLLRAMANGVPFAESPYNRRHVLPVGAVLDMGRSHCATYLGRGLWISKFGKGEAPLIICDLQELLLAYPTPMLSILS